jgi:hypothetical protein
MRRLDMKLARARTQVTGSHAGYVGNGNVLVPGSVGNISTMDALTGRGLSSVYRFDQFYNASLTNVQAYAKLKDLEWSLKRPVRGEVKVGELESVPVPADAAPHDVPPPVQPAP